jgi:hypothetical protein
MARKKRICLIGVVALLSSNIQKYYRYINKNENLAQEITGDWTKPILIVTTEIIHVHL